MRTMYSIGEVLIDFIPLQKGKALKDVVEFERAPGGAPANVAAAVAKYGGRASMITKLGNDAFGDFLLEQLQQAGVMTDNISRTSEANTGLAFVSLRADGERDFSFYRNPSADLLLHESEIEENWFEEGDILHFCSVDLVESPMKQAHVKAIRLAKDKGSIISFDPNVRLPLWEHPEACRNTILEFIPKAHLVKISDEELEFITGIDEVDRAIQSLFVGDVKAVIFTKGSHGAELYIKGQQFQSSGFAVDVQDTTGAGDAFIGGFLYKLLEKNVRQQNLEEVLHKYHQEILTYANASGALTTTGKGAISSLPTKEEIIQLLQK
ncbi:carbohydrate kinase [Bacillus sp. AFS076308]|uniref:carbohydrate kinase family protein n=1 Tax=unclassified Bacillus (in: firmicutes) TaxID=185979 RepID=UPI000BF588D1|nr:MULTISPECIES: carbohydrate kinase [unclassified Bacillus (in: firmicutes)]PFN95899.1 carbohydrate kinase [Bacillus sp. AFS076308]PGV49224.1 carbohydrate kinase [Bacillus sp. AFS037270]